MVSLISFVLAAAAIVIAVPAILFFLEVVAALVLPTRKSAPCKHVVRPSVAVLIPAHNESTNILPTLQDIKPQLVFGDRIVVVADNCVDDTAVVAAEAGTEVIDRNEPARVGKGFALDFGLKHLGKNPPQVVVIIDADCRVADGTIDQLVTVCATKNRPVQALDLMISPDGSPINIRVAEFAWRVKNWMRPLGLSALGLPCQLMGTGMAFPWAVIKSANLASGQVVEDLNLGLELARAGRPPMFCPSAKVTSTFPTTVSAADRQRQRWEQGHVDLILAQAPRLIISSIKRGDLGLFVMAVDLAIPPLSLLFLLTTGMLLLASVAAWLGGSSAALIVGIGSFASLTIAVLLAWVTFARDILPPRALWSIVPYVLRKLGLYWRFVSGGRVSQWIRTDRK